jgi:hypothetical protein
MYVITFAYNFKYMTVSGIYLAYTKGKVDLIG